MSSAMRRATRAATGSALPVLAFSNEEIAKQILPRFAGNAKSANAAHEMAVGVLVLEETDRLANLHGRVDPQSVSQAVLARLPPSQRGQLTEQFVDRFYELHTLFLLAKTDLCRVPAHQKHNAIKQWQKHTST
jgi:hypothetical protein